MSYVSDYWRLYVAYNRDHNRTSDGPMAVSRPSPTSEYSWKTELITNGLFNDFNEASISFAAENQGSINAKLSHFAFVERLSVGPCPAYGFAQQWCSVSADHAS